MQISYKSTQPPGGGSSSFRMVNSNIGNYTAYPLGGRTTICNRATDSYRFGFNGMEKDNDLKGIGNSLDFGARMYDSRLGRFFSVDKYSNKYVGWSPYAFSLNNSIMLKDADGNIVVDRLGNPVTVTYKQNAIGNYSAEYTFAPETKQNVIDHFNANGGKIINTLIQVKTGREMVNKVVASSDKIHTRIIPAKGSKPEGNIEGLILGKTVYLPNFGVSGSPALQVTINEASIKQSLKDYKDPAIKSEPKSPAGEMVNNYLTDDQQIGAVVGHEWEHATNPVDVGEAKSGKDIPRNDPRHKPAYDKGTQISNEFGELNKTK